MGYTAVGRVYGVYEGMVDGLGLWVMAAGETSLLTSAKDETKSDKNTKFLSEP